MPCDPPHYHLLARKGSRIQYGVDHSAYMSTLAKDFGGAPGLIELWQAHGLRILLTYCFGAAFVTFYRLVGPFKSPEAPKIVSTELAETITRRGILGNLFFGVSGLSQMDSLLVFDNNKLRKVIPMLFYGIINACALGLELCGLIPKEKNMV